MCQTNNLIGVHVNTIFSLLFVKQNHLAVCIIYKRLLCFYFRHMKNIRDVSLISTDIPPVRFNPIGLNQFIKLVIYNTQSKTTNLRTDKVWRQVIHKLITTEDNLKYNNMNWKSHFYSQTLNKIKKGLKNKDIYIDK